MGHVYNLKQFKVQIIAILEEIDSFYWTKMHLWKVSKIGQGPPPPFGKIQKSTSFSLWNCPLVGARSLLQLQISFNFRFRTTATTLQRFLHTWYQTLFAQYGVTLKIHLHLFFTSDGRIDIFLQKLCLLLNKTNILPWFFICWKSKISARQILPFPLRFLID